MRTAIAFVLAIIVSVPVLAGPPLNGTYKSTDLGGPVLPGRYSESWPLGAPLTVNNTVNELSWDGATLGTQWWWYCPSLAAPPTLLLDTVFGGNGNKIWRLNYSGGVCIFDGLGAWGNGDPSYTAVASVWVVILTQTFSGGVVIGEVRTTNVQATFLGYQDNCLSMSVYNSVWLGNTNGGPVPPNYPAFLAAGTCAPTVVAGEWGDVTQITVDILGCDVVPVSEKTWGAVKSMYKN